MNALDNRPTAHYPGDVRQAVGQLMGPTTAGEVLVVDEVTFDVDADRSTARFRYVTADDYRTRLVS